MEKRVRVWVISPDVPDDKSVGWIDTSTWNEWVMKAYKDGEWTTLSVVDDEKIPAPDWGQNDSENKNYIKGRTHWEIAGDFVNVYIYNTSIEIQGWDVNANVFDIFRDAVPEFVKLYDSLIALHGIGKQPFLEVTFAQDSSNNDITQYINFESWGNSYEVLANSDENSYEITGLEFRIKGEFAYTDGDYTYIKLPEEYIPNTIARTSAMVFEKGRGSNSVQQKNARATAIGSVSVAEGWYTTASGDYSHAQGQNNVANNIAEHASGRFNKSTKTAPTYGDAGNTTLSHGIGTSDTDRKNAFEIMENGDCYFYNIGDYHGNNYLSALTLQHVINNICVPMFVFGSIEPSGFTPDSGQPSYAEALSAYKSGRRVILVDTSQSIYEDVIQYNELVGGLKTIDSEWVNT